MPEAVPTTAAEPTAAPTSSVVTTDTTSVPPSTVPDTSATSIPATAPAGAAAAIERFKTNASISEDLQFLLPSAEAVSNAMKLDPFLQTRDGSASLFQTLALSTTSVTQGGWVREVQTSSGSEMIRFEAQLVETPAKAAAIAADNAASYKKVGVIQDSTAPFQAAFPAGSLGTSSFVGAFNVSSPERPCRAVASGAVSRVVFLAYLNTTRCDKSHSIETASFVRFSVQTLQTLATQTR